MSICPRVRGHPVASASAQSGGSCAAGSASEPLGPLPDPLGNSRSRAPRVARRRTREAPIWRGPALVATLWLAAPGVVGNHIGWLKRYSTGLDELRWPSRVGVLVVNTDRGRPERVLPAQLAEAPFPAQLAEAPSHGGVTGRPRVHVSPRLGRDQATLLVHSPSHRSKVSTDSGVGAPRSSSTGTTRPSTSEVHRQSGPSPPRLGERAGGTPQSHCGWWRYCLHSSSVRPRVSSASAISTSSSRSSAHTRTTPSVPADTRREPSGLKSTAATGAS